MRSAFATPSRLEAASALVAVALVQIEVWGFWVEAEMGPAELAAVAGSAMGLTLLWSRRSPLAALVAACAVWGAWLAFATPSGSLAPFLILLAAVFAAAAAASLGPALAAGALALLAVGGEVAFEPDALANFAWVGGLTALAWGAGRAAHGRQERADRLERRAVLAEREREARARAAVAEERARVARELHDVIAHSVSVMVIQAQAAQQLAGADSPTLVPLARIEDTGRQALTELRRLLGLLRREDDELALGPPPSLRHLDALTATVRAAGLPVDVRVDGQPIDLPPGVDLSAYRIIQEALTNALKHAGPAHASVVVRYRADDVELEITDDGTGPAQDVASDGHGLVGMRERAGVYGGSVAGGRRAEGGYEVRARLPLEAR